MKDYILDIPAEPRPLGRSVLFLDQNQWCNEPHEWIREYFRGAGYDLIEPPPTVAWSLVFRYDNRHGF